jgi:lysine 2-monooxygenase
MSDYVFDVAVVGAGVSGVYAAWRIKNADVSEGSVGRQLAAPNGRGLSVGLFECSDRIGGRLFSVTMPNAPHLPVELGGMRFLDLHKRVVGLVKHLGLEHRPMPLEDPGDDNLNYLRGQRFTAADWKRPSFDPPYRLDEREQDRSPGDLVSRVARKYDPPAASLHNKGFWNLLYEELSAEAYSLVKDAGGYHTIVTNWNAAAAVPWFLADFDPNSKYRALQDGFQRLPEALAEEFHRQGGCIHRHHRLHRLDRSDSDGNGLFRLVFDAAGTDSFAHHRRVQKPVVCRARHVLLCLPRRAIELLDPESFLFDSDQFAADLRSVLPQPALKVFAAYREPWWETAKGITAGRSVTDLPIRQCYYWGTEGKQRGADTANRNSILMASYNDGASVEFWSGLARTGPYVPPAAVYEEAAAAADPVPEQLRAPDGMVKEMQEQLRELHDLAPGAIPEPYETVYCDWTQEPYGGGWHFWKIHVRPAEVMPRIQQPIDNANVYVCGEAWSTQQGWVEGALETADSVLENHLGLPPPAWMGGAAPPSSPSGVDISPSA